MGRRFCISILVATFGLALFAAQAFAEGETLTMVQNDPAAVAGKATHFTASGELNENDTMFGFDIFIFAKDPEADPVCAADFDTESAAAASSGGRESWVSPPGGFQVGYGPSYNQPFTITFGGAGKYLLCGYVQGDFSTFASNKLLGTVSPAPVTEKSSTPTGPGAGHDGAPAAGGPPAIVGAPWITRRGHVLTCHPGSWSNQPTSFTYGWYPKKGSKKLGSGRTLKVRRSFRGHPVVCRVTARNAVGAKAVSSGPLRAR
jgi:hypothetical protein